MSRAGYHDDDGDGNWNLIRWRGAVTSATRGKRGQAFLREMLVAFDALPEKRLVAGDLEVGGEVCAIGAVGRARGVPMGEIDPECYEDVAGRFDLAEALAREIMWINDDCGRHDETPEDRFKRLRRWVEGRVTLNEMDGG